MTHAEYMHKQKKAYQGVKYQVVVDGHEVATFNTLKELSLNQRIAVSRDYAKRLMLGAHKVTVIEV